jgi:hypothetical protein
VGRAGGADSLGPDENEALPTIAVLGELEGRSFQVDGRAAQHCY